MDASRQEEDRRPRTTRWWAAAVAALLVASLVVSVPLVAGPVAGASLTVPEVSSAQLLHNPSFEEGLRHWDVVAGTDVAVRRGPAAQDRHFLQMSAGSAGVGAGISETVAMAPQAGASYRASVMLRAPGPGPVPVGLVLWAVGGAPPVELETTGVEVSGSVWRPYSVELDVAQSGHRALMVELYLVTAHQKVDVDAALLENAGLANASFEQGLDSWSLTSGANAALLGPGAAEDAHYLEINTGTAGPGAGIAQDVSTAPVARHTYQAEIMVRSPTGQPVEARLALFALGGPAPTEVARSTFTVRSTSFKLHAVALDVKEKGFSDLRFKVTVFTPGANLDLDAAGLGDTGLKNATFSGISGWGHTEGMQVATRASTAFEDSTYLKMATGQAGPKASIWQTADTFLPAGASFGAVVWLRSPAARPLRVHLSLTATGSGPTESATSSEWVVSTGWSRYSIDLDTSSTHQALALKVTLSSVGAPLDVGAAALQVPESSPVAPSPPSPERCTKNNSCSPKTFAEALLAAPGIGAPATAPNLFALETWFAAEGGGAGCPGQPPYRAPWSSSPGPAANPLNTTQRDQGSNPTPWNWVGVQQYEDAGGRTCWHWGLVAEDEALTNGYYGPILSVLDHPAPTLLAQCDALAAAVGSTPWGTGDFSRDC